MLAKDKAQGLPAQVFGLSRPLPLFFCHCGLFFCPGLSPYLGLPGLSTFFRFLQFFPSPSQLLQNSSEILKK